MTPCAKAGPQRGRRFGGAVLGLLAALATPAAAEDLKSMKREAARLIQELERELEAVREERRALKREREALGTAPATARPGAPAAPPATTAEAPAPGAPTTPTETARKVDVLTDEVAKLKENLFLPETKELKSYYGLGPAASKVYQVSRGLSLGGYGEGFLNKTVSDTAGSQDRADALRFVLYTGYKFSDRILLNTELEFEHATTSSTVSSSGGSVSLEFAYLDFLGWDYLNARTGLVLVPLGFLNEIHEPTYFFGNNRPEVERVIIPTTWRELGAGVFGQLGPDLQYRTYGTTSLNAAGFTDMGIRGGRQQGNRALAENAAWSARLDYTPNQLPGFLFGASTFMGNTTQDERFDDQRVNGFMRLSDVHMQYNAYGVWLRGLYAFGTLEDAEQISVQNEQPIGSRYYGYYVEAAYDFMPIFFPDFTNQSLQPFFRYERYDPQASVPAGFTPDESQDTELFTVGVSYKPHPQVVLKFDYRNFTLAEGVRPDDVNVGLGFVF